MKGTEAGRVNVRQTRRWLIAALLAVTAFIAAPSLASADSGTGTPIVSTDQLSYSPGGVVDLSGAGFAAGDMVSVTLADSLTGATYGSSAALVSSDGSFTGALLALPSSFMSSLTATATDSATGDTASTPVAETPSLPTFTPTVTTDQQDYAPGSVVTISGSGWPAGDSVSVVTDDSDNHSWSQTDQVTTDASGEFTDQVTLPQMFVANYSVTASDAMGLTATTAFSDGNVTLHLPATEGVANMTVSYDRFNGTNSSPNGTCSGTPSLSSTVTATSGGTVNIPGFGGNTDSVRLTGVTTTTAGKTFDKWTSGDNHTDSGTLLPGSPTPCIANGTPGTNGNVTDAYAHFKNSNTPPTATVALNSATPRTNDTLTATATKNDADGNPVTLTYVWKNGSTVVKTTSGTSLLTDTLDLSQAGNGNKGDIITVTVTPNDGIVDGNPASASATVQNTPPVVTLSGANNLSPNEGTATTYNYSISDADGDTIASVATSCGTGTKSSPTNTNTAGSFVCTFADGPAGTSVSAQATDSGFGAAAGNTASQSISVQNVAPTVAISGAASVNEGSSYSLTLGAVTDPGADTVSSYVVHWGDGNSNTYSTNGAKTHTYADGPNDYTITVDLTDEDGTFNGANTPAPFQVHVNNVAPTIAISGNASVNEGSSYSLTLGAVTDPGTDTVTTYVVHWGDGTMNSYSTNGAKTHTYADGPNDFIITVDLVDEDGTFNGANTPAPFQVHVNNVAPTVTFSAANDQSVNEGSSHTYTYTISDPGQDTISSVSTSCDPPHGSKVAASDSNTNTSGSFQCTFPDGPDTADLTASATDSDGDTGNTAHQSVTVNNVAPTVTFSAANDQSVNEGSSHTYTYTISDPGQDTISSVSTSCDPPHGSKVALSDSNTNTSGSFQCTFPDGPDTANLTASATDSDSDTGNTAHQSVTINNVAPHVTLTGDASVNEGTTHSYTFTVTDPGQDTFSVNTGYPDCGTGGQYVSGSLSTTASGGSFQCFFPDGPATTDVKIKVTDSDGASTSDSESVQVVQVANVAPSVTAPSDQSSNEGDSHSFNLGSFSDPGPDSPWQVSVDWGDGSGPTSFQVTASGAVSGQSLGSKTHTYADGPNDYTVTVTVTDKNGGVGDTTFSVHVNNVAPTVTFSAANDQSVNEGSTHTYTYTISDPGQDTISSVSTSCDSPHGSKVAASDSNTNTSGSFQCTFPDGPDTADLTASATDSDGATGNTAHQSVTVNNVAPTVTFSAANDQSVNEGSSHTYTYTISDPGQDTISSVSTSCDPPHGSKVAASDSNTNTSGSFQCTFPDGPDTADLTASATDSDGATGNTAHQSVTVNNVAPTVTFSAANDQSVNEGSSHTYTYTISDPGQDTISSVSTSCDPPHGSKVAASDSNTNTSGSFQCTFPDGPDTADLTASATDSDGATGNTAHQSVTVNNVAPTVTFSAANDQSVNEGSSHTYTYTISDPGQDTISSVSTSCDPPHGSKVALSDSNTNTSGSFQCTFPDGPRHGQPDRLRHRQRQRHRQHRPPVGHDQQRRAARDPDGRCERQRGHDPHLQLHRQRPRRRHLLALKRLPDLRYRRDGRRGLVHHQRQLRLAKRLLRLPLPRRASQHQRRNQVRRLRQRKHKRLRTGRDRPGRQRQPVRNGSQRSELERRREPLLQPRHLLRPGLGQPLDGLRQLGRRLIGRDVLDHR